jgi:hypothetical protein
MNNRVQQRFDRSIREAVAATKAAEAARPTRDVTPPKPTRRERKPKGTLRLCPNTGATVWYPAGVPVPDAGE